MTPSEILKHCQRLDVNILVQHVCEACGEAYHDANPLAVRDPSLSEQLTEPSKTDVCRPCVKRWMAETPVNRKIDEEWATERHRINTLNSLLAG